MELTTLQNEAVEKLFNVFSPVEKRSVSFKAPTGSGKTLMAGALIARMISRFDDENFVFVIATVSSADLPASFERKLNKYKKDLECSRFEVEYVASPSDTKTDKCESVRRLLPERNKVFIFGKSSFGKGRIFTEHGIIEDFVKGSVDSGCKIVYIRDEAHIGAKDNGERREKEDSGARRFEDLMREHAFFVVKMTATPARGEALVELREKDLRDASRNGGKFLLKSRAEPILDSSMDDTEVLECACRKFKEIQKAYDKLAIGVRPAMLIQVDNSSSKDDDRRADFEAVLAAAKRTIEKAGLSWAQYFGDGEKASDRGYGGAFTLDDLTKGTSEIDVVLFKIGPATGWDIPRACMLVQLRSVSSRNLAVQTLGRIKRNPYPGLERNDVTDVYYVLSNEEASGKDREVVQYNYSVQDKFRGETFLRVEITNRREIVRENVKKQTFQKALGDYLDDENAHLHQLVGSFFIDGAYRKVLMTTSNGKEITSSVSNPFIFMRDYRRMLARNRAIVDRIGCVARMWAKKVGIREEFLMTVLLETRIKELRNLVSAARKTKPVFSICEATYEPGDYHEIFDASEKAERVRKADYLFSITESGGDGKNRQPLDSSPEEVVFGVIDEFAEDNELVQVWAKNQATSNICGDYLDENLEIRRSFFDFIVKFKNGVYLYLEVKGKNDIDKEKTEMLRNAYRQYFRKCDLFSPRLAVAICKVDANRQIELDVFYDETTYAQLNLKNETLSGLMAHLSSIVS